MRIRRGGKTFFSMNEAPKILHLITRLDCGGSAISTILAVDRLRNHNFQTALAFGRTNDPDGSIRELLSRRAITSLYLPELVRDPSPRRDLAALNGIRRLLKQGGYDLVHTNTSKAGALGRLAAHWRGIPVVHTPHGHIFYGYFPRPVTAFYVAIERFLARYTARIISLTDAETREALARGIGRKEQYVTIPCGVALEQFRNIPANLGAAFRSNLQIPAEALVFLSVGRLVPVKGFDILLNAFARADFAVSPAQQKNVFLVIVGDGEERRGLESLAGQLGVSNRVRFTGELQDIRGTLGGSNAFVLASRNEGLGTVFIEAMAAGLAVIGPAVGGVPSLIQDRQSGLLFPGENSAALAKALSEIALDDELRNRLGQNGASKVAPRYEHDAFVARLAALYAEVLGAKER